MPTTTVLAWLVQVYRHRDVGVQHCLPLSQAQLGKNPSNGVVGRGTQGKYPRRGSFL